ncbi:MAG: extracellular solute-binding protein family 1 [Anaerocolumna sp.]|jgi:arabinogalactan oligomer/maltooligosaccharide transport system substrate-binding protein|nr:extracellular solute-binding protein family 1 [Anaerocolumna sp.]
MKRKIVSLLLVGLLLFSLTGCKKELPVEDDYAESTVSDEVANNKNNEISLTDSETNSENSVDSDELSSDTTSKTEVKLVPEEGAHLLFWTPDIEFGEAVAKNFEAEYGVPVTVEEVGLGAIDKIALSGPAGTGADIFMCPHDSFEHGVSSGLFLELDNPIVSGLKERVNEVGLKTVTSANKTYGVPISLETSCLFYNKDIVGDTPAKTLEEIFDKAKGFNDPNNNKFYILYTIGDGYKIYPMLSAYGFSLFGKDGLDADNPGFDTDEFEKGLELVSSLKDVMPINSTDLGNVSFLQNQFTEGKVAYEITGPWDIKTFKKSGVNFGVTVLPTFNGNALTPFAGVQNAHVSAFTNYPNAAQLFAEYLVTDESASLLYEKADKIPTLKDVTNVKGIAEDEYIKPFVMQFANSYPMPSVKRISYYWSISAGLCQAVFDGQLTPKEGREKAVADWNTMLTTE